MCCLTKPPLTSTGESKKTAVTGALCGVTPINDCPDERHHSLTVPSLQPRTIELNY